MYATITAAIHVARKQAALQETEMFVIYEDGEYDACSASDLDTWYSGIQSCAIIHCLSPDGRFS